MEASHFDQTYGSTYTDDWGINMQTDVQYEEPDQNYDHKPGNMKSTNPYKMPRNLVRLRHFRNANIYDPDAVKGFEVQRWYARKMYNAWLRDVRKQANWKSFRRAQKIIYSDEDDESSVVFKRMTPIKTGEVISKRDGKKNPSKHGATAQSKEKGVTVNDTDFRPRMFTEKMGREIAAIRNSHSWSQAELGKMINVNAGTIRDIEAGGRIPFNPEDVMVKALAKALGLSSIKYQE